MCQVATTGEGWSHSQSNKKVEVTVKIWRKYIAQSVGLKRLEGGGTLHGKVLENGKGVRGNQYFSCFKCDSW